MLKHKLVDQKYNNKSETLENVIKYLFTYFYLSFILCYRIDARRQKIESAKSDLAASQTEEEKDAANWMAAEALAQDDESAITSMAALAEVKGATYAKDLFFKVKDSRAQEAAVSKKATLRTQKRMATIRSDRGLKFERFVAGPHGARDVDLEGVEKHAKAMALKGVVDESDSDEDEEGDSDEEEGEEEGGEEGGGGVGGGGGES